VIKALAHPKVLGWLLVVSIGLNLFMGAIVVGRVAGQAVQAHRSLQAAVAVLPPEKRDAVRQEIRSLVPVMRQHAKAMRTLRAELAEQLARQPLDEAALDRQFLKLQQQTTATQAQLQQAFKRASATLTPQERADLWAAIQKRSRRGTAGEEP
jgi:uncharacterized membrane protein